ncbi:MAG TPA: hypothetical protein VEK76_08570 [Candidatus Binatia bacterium]|nr:hypothetical protein [Candidatus Binatia bacterium]
MAAAPDIEERLDGDPLAQRLATARLPAMAPERRRQVLEAAAAASGHRPGPSGDARRVLQAVAGVSLVLLLGVRLAGVHLDTGSGAAPSPTASPSVSGSPAPPGGLATGTGTNPDSDHAAALAAMARLQRAIAETASGPASS